MTGIPDDLVEKAARASHAYDMRDIGGVTWENDGDANRTEWLGSAAAALEAVGLPALLERVERQDKEIHRAVRRAERERDALAAKVADAEVQVNHLDLVAKQVREQGDVRQVLLDEDGVGEAPSLADELWIIAYNLRAALGGEGEKP